LPTAVEISETLEQLAEQTKAGCALSFERIVEQMKDRIFAYLVQLVGNMHDAEDLAQDTFIKAYKGIHTFDGRARFSTWLYTIAKNTAFTHLRKRRPHDSIEELSEILPAPESGIDLDAQNSIWTLARKLKPNLFEVLWLFYADGFSMKEIATITGTNSITARVNLHRARLALRKKCKLYENF
jgi:RNA polymerase sigma-70 factor (ECF subfamily)